MSGYEIHCGVSEGPATADPAVWLEDGRGDGARSDDGRVIGTYLHGIFDHPEALGAWLGDAGLHAAMRFDIQAQREATLERLADAVDAHMDVATLERIFGVRRC